jgi:hypothetical protein
MRRGKPGADRIGLLNSITNLYHIMPASAGCPQDPWSLRASMGLGVVAGANAHERRPPHLRRHGLLGMPVRGPADPSAGARGRMGSVGDWPMASTSTEQREVAAVKWTPEWLKLAVMALLQGRPYGT